MKKLISLLIGLTVMGLLFTKSGYVEVNEFVIIAISLSVFTVITGLFFKSKGEGDAAKGSTAFIVIFAFWILALFDMIADHVLYFQPTGNEDGRALTLGEKIQEFGDDLFMMWIVTAVFVLLTSVVFSKIIMKTIYKRV